MPETTAASLARLWREVRYVDVMGDYHSDMIEARLTRLEEVAAARWPRRWILAARLRRELRASARDYPGTFAEARAHAGTVDFCARAASWRDPGRGTATRPGQPGRS